LDQDTLISILAHELRSSLWGADGFLRLIKEDLSSQLDHDVQEYLEKAHQSLKEASSFVSRLIDLNRVVNTPVTIHEIDIALMAEEVWDKIVHEFREKGVSFRCQRMKPVFSDPNLLRLILNELLSNARKAVQFTTRPRVQFSCSRTKEGKHIYEIRDNGIGFDMSKVGRLFEPCFKFHPRVKFPGSGLGLCITKESLQLLEGTISASSEPGQGSVFCFTLP